MTIPIIPGPFSFLAGAGQALGQYGQVREEHRRQALAERTDAAERAVRLVMAGILGPEALTPEMLQGAGVELPGGVTPQEPPSVSLARTQARQAPRRGEAEIRGLEAGATTAEATAAVAPEMAQAGLTVARGQAERQPFETTIASQRARAAEAQADLEIAQSGALSAAFKGVTEIFGQPGNEEFKSLARAAVMGILPYYTQRLQATFGGQATRHQILLEALGNINSLFLQQYKVWEDGLNSAKGRGLFRDMTDEEARAAYMKEAPPPDFNTIRDQYVQTTLGLSPEEFTAAIRRAIPTATGAGPRIPSQTPTPGAGGAGAPGAAGTTSPQIQAYMQILLDPQATIDPKTGKPLSGEELYTRLSGRLNEEQMLQLLQAIITANVHPELRKIIVQRTYGAGRSR